MAGRELNRINRVAQQAARVQILAIREPDTELPDYLTPAGRPVKDHFGLCSSITGARLRNRSLAKTSPALTP